MGLASCFRPRDMSDDTPVRTPRPTMSPGITPSRSAPFRLCIPSPDHLTLPTVRHRQQTKKRKTGSTLEANRGIFTSDENAMIDKLLGCGQDHLFSRGPRPAPTTTTSAGSSRRPPSATRATPVASRSTSPTPRSSSRIPRRAPTPSTGGPPRCPTASWSSTRPRSTSS